MYKCYESAEFKDLLGKTLVSVINKDNEELIFTTNEGSQYTQYHSQDCCESVNIDDIVGDLEDLIGLPILQADEASQEGMPKNNDGYEDESSTWTFYILATNKGSVTIKWYGSSNGYYSESVDFRKDK